MRVFFKEAEIIGKVTKIILSYNGNGTVEFPYCESLNPRELEKLKNQDVIFIEEGSGFLFKKTR